MTKKILIGHWRKGRRVERREEEGRKVERREERRRRNKGR